jgi:KDO2-lipid IV(A) lauroyltransferase
VYYVLTAFAGLIGRLSSEAIDGLARALAWLSFDLLRIRRRLILRNLEIAFGDEKTPAERLAIGRSSVYHTILTFLEFFRSTRTDIAGDIELRGVEHARAALAEGRGVYVLCFHMGNWEAMGAKYSRAIVPSYIVVKRVGGPSVDRFVSSLRARNGFLTVKREKKGDGYRQILNVLQRGEVVGFVIDQARPGEPKLPFFGRPAKTNTSFAAIWRRRPAPIIPSYVTRSGVSRHTIEILPPVELAITGDAEKDILAHSEQFNRIVEACVRKCPEQYFWMHNRWK